MRTKKAVYNLVASLALQFITAIVGFILPKLFIDAYGSSVNGLVSSIKQFLSYLYLVEAGVGMASIAALYKPLADKDKTSINGILSATKRFYWRSGYIFTALVICMAFIYPFIVRGQVDQVTVFLMVIILGGSGICEFFLIGKYRVLLTADQKVYVISCIQIIGTLLNAITYVLLIKLGYSVVLVNAAATLIYVLRVIFLRVYITKKYKYIKFNVAPRTEAINRRWDALIHQIAGLVVFNTPIIIITVFLGLAEVSVYAVYNMVFMALAMIVGSFANGMLAAFGDILAKGNNPVLLKGYNAYEYIYYAVLAWSYTCASLLIMPFIEIYTKGIDDANYIRPILALLFVLVGIANNIRVPSNTLVSSAAHFKETRKRAILESLINLIASLIFVQFFGIAGVLLGGILSFAYRTVDFIMYASKNILKRSPMYTVRKLVRNLSLSLIAASPFIFIIQIQASNFLEWFIWALSISIWTLLVIIGGNALFEFKTFIYIVQRLKRIF